MTFDKMIATRDGFGDEIVELGKENKNVLVVDADIGKSCKTGAFRKELPEQYLNVGIAEQNCAGVAAGLATCGKIPFVVTYAAFGSMRMCEMIRQEACYPNLNVKVACSHGGVTPANDGAGLPGHRGSGHLPLHPQHDRHHAGGLLVHPQAGTCRRGGPRSGVPALYPRQGPRDLR